jgi:predicted DNA-binding mobile mystery protein A
MNNQKRNLQIEQLDRKIKSFSKLNSLTMSRGWVYATRIALGMSLAQLGKKMNITAQSVKEIEQREQAGTISLKTLTEVARAINLKLVYGFSSPEKSLEKMIALRARSLAEKIVSRTHKTMQLEDQANSRTRLRKAIKDRTAEIINKNIKSLWD